MLADVDPEPIWHWGFVERVSTGLACLQAGMTRDGRAMLTVAERVTGISLPATW